MGISKRVLIFTTAYRPLVGGSEIALEQTIKRLPDIFFDVITPRLVKGTQKIETKDNYQIYRLGFGSNFSKYIFPLLGYLKGRQLIKRNNISLIHAYQASYGGGAAWLLKTFCPEVKFILTLQEGKNLAKQSWLVVFIRRLIIKKADVITAISEYLKKVTYSINPKVPIIVIPNGVDFKYFSSPRSDEEILERLGIKRDERIIITVSRLVPKNGLADLVDAFAFLKKELFQAKLLIIGNGPLLSKLKDKTAELGLTNDVYFLGQIENNKLPDYLMAADVFVRPSLSEGLGNSFLEAMAAGVPVIGTSVGGITDFIKDGETGLLCKVGDSHGLANAMLKILSDKQLKSSLITNAQTLVAEKYNWDAIAEKFGKLYHDYETGD